MAKRSSIRNTKSVLVSLGPGEDAWDSEIKGFGIRCQTKGRSYVLKTTINRRQKWITIGPHGSPWTPATARARALELLGRTVKGEDPTKTAEQETVTIK